MGEHLLPAPVAAPASPSSPKELIERENFAKGERVNVQYKNGLWYAGTMLSFREGAEAPYVIVYDDTRIKPSFKCSTEVESWELSKQSGRKFEDSEVRKLVLNKIIIWL